MKKIVLFMALAALCCACGAKVELPQIIKEKAFSGLDKAQMEAQYKAGKAEWDAACAFLSRPDLDTMKCGKYPLTEAGTYALVQEYDLDPEAVRKFEIHRKFIDIQYVIGGEEMIYVCRHEDLQDRLKDYSDKKDVEFFARASKQDGYVMNPSCMVIVFPSDPHMPGCVPPSGAGHVRKVVVKVPVAQ